MVRSAGASTTVRAVDVKGTRYRIEHRTTYRYSQPMSDGYTVAVLTARETPFQRVLHAAVTVHPEPDERDEHDDLFGNRVTFVGVHRPHDELTVLATSEVHVVEPPEFGAGPAWEDVVAATTQLRGIAALEVGPFVGSSRFVTLADLREQLLALARPSFPPGRPVVEALGDLCRELHAGFEFDPTFSEVATPLRDVLESRRGVCQDFAHLAVGALRSLGLACRYVSGYIETDAPPGRARLAGADASHAWVSAWVPSIGWVDFDPTNGALPVHRHIVTAWGRDYGDVIPVRGVVIGPAAEQRLDVGVDVVALRG